MDEYACKRRSCGHGVSGSCPNTGSPQWNMDGDLRWTTLYGISARFGLQLAAHGGVVARVPWVAGSVAASELVSSRHAPARWPRVLLQYRDSRAFGFGRLQEGDRLHRFRFRVAWSEAVHFLCRCLPYLW